MNPWVLAFLTCSSLAILAQAFDWAGKLWALPVTLVGLLAGAVGCLFGAKATRRNNAIAFENFPWGRPFSAMTLGNCILATCSLDLRVRTYNGAEAVVLGDHEEGHTYQYQRRGIFFLIAWLLGGRQSDDNRLEHLADEYAEHKEGKQ